MEKQIALVAFKGEPMCFVHVLLNALDMKEKGYDIKMIIEGSATKMIKELANEEAPFSNLYQQVKEKGLIDCVCQACANKMDVLKSVKEQNLRLGNDLKGHPSLAKYIDQGYQIITF